MSNKTELQANNVELQEILNSVNALPDAGGGGGVETCTVQFSYIDSLWHLPGVLYYTKPDLTFGSSIYQMSQEEYVPSISVTVLKNSIVVLAGSVGEGKLGCAEAFAVKCRGDCESLIESFMGGCALYVTGDCDIEGANG